MRRGGISHIGMALSWGLGWRSDGSRAEVGRKSDGPPMAPRWPSDGLRMTFECGGKHLHDKLGRVDVIVADGAAQCLEGDLALVKVGLGAAEGERDERGEHREERGVKQRGRQEEADRRRVERKQTEEVEVGAQTRVVARHALQRVAARDLLLELVDARESDVARLAAVDELGVVDGSATQQGVGAAKDVLGHVDRLRGLRDTARAEGPNRVPHVGVAVVQAHLRRRAAEGRV